MERKKDELWSVYIQRLLPRDSKIEIHYKREVKVGSIITKGNTICTFNFQNSVQRFEVKTDCSGKIEYLLDTSHSTEEEIKPRTLVLCKIEPCKHEVIFDGVCSICFETGLERHSQIIFDKISNIAAADHLVSEKIKELTKGKKQILILDLDNTIIHARQVPLNFSIRKYYEKRKCNETENLEKVKKVEEFNEYLEKAKQFDCVEDYFEICHTRRHKYLVHKRPHLHEFLR